MSSIDVNIEQISPPTFCCYDVLQGSDGNQYVVTDMFGQPNNDERYVVLDRLSDEERVAADLLDGWVQLL